MRPLNKLRRLDFRWCRTRTCSRGPNRPTSQAQQCMRQSFHNAPFCNRKKWCILGNWIGVMWDLCNRSTTATMWQPIGMILINSLRPINLSERGRHWFMWWLVAYSVPSHYMNKTDWLLYWKHTLPKFDLNTIVFNQENQFENVVSTAGFDSLQHIQCYMISHTQ